MEKLYQVTNYEKLTHVYQLRADTRFQRVYSIVDNGLRDDRDRICLWLRLQDKF